MEKIEKKVDRIEKIALENKSELNNLAKKIDEVIAYQQNIKPVDVDALEDFIHSSKTTFTKLESITTIHADSGLVAANMENNVEDNSIKEVLDGSKKLAAKLDEVNKEAVKIKDHLNNDSKDIKAEVDKISKNVLSMVECLKINPPVIEKSEDPSVRPKQVKKNIEEATDDKDDDVEILEPKRRKGIFFSSSIGLQCDIQKLANDINSKICLNKTYHIEKHEEAKDPELYLRKTLTTLEETKDANFIIISVGSNDITKLNIEEDIKELNEKACEQSRNLANIAEEASKKYDIDVFVVERPARFDREAKDPQGIRSILTISSNGILPSLITPMRRVHFIPLPSLTANPDRDCFSRDGVHLTSKGEALFHHDLVEGVKSVFSDLSFESFQLPNTKNFKKDGNQSNDNPGNRNNSGGRNTRRQTEGNTRFYDGWSNPRGWRGNRDNERGFQPHNYDNNRRNNYHNHTAGQRPSHYYHRYSESRYIPQDRRQYDGPRQSRHQEQNRYRVPDSQYSQSRQNRYQYRQQAQMDRDYQHRFAQDYERY